MSIAIFYHVHKTNNWENVFLQQIHRLCVSGLYSAADFIHIGINGLTKELPVYMNKFKSTVNQIHIDEIETLISLHNFAVENKDYKILYLHTKGVTNHPNSLSVLSWRLYLEYFNIDRWQECVSLLNNHDCVGVEGLFDYLDTRNPADQKLYPGHYAGNFWWARADYISTLNCSYLQPDFRGKPGIRELGELWIGTKNPKYYNFKTSKYEGRYLYENIISPNDYMEIS